MDLGEWYAANLGTAYELQLTKLTNVTRTFE